MYEALDISSVLYILCYIVTGFAKNIKLRTCLSIDIMHWVYACRYARWRLRENNSLIARYVYIKNDDNNCVIIAIQEMNVSVSLTASRLYVFYEIEEY